MQNEQERFSVFFERPGEPLKGKKKRKHKIEQDESVIDADSLFADKSDKNKENDETVYIGDTDLTELVKENNSDEMS